MVVTVRGDTYHGDGLTFTYLVKGNQWLTASLSVVPASTTCAVST